MALFACGECGNMISTTAAACPKCGAPVPADAAGFAAQDEAAPAFAPVAPGDASPAAPARKGGMSKGCLAAIGCGVCLFGGVGLTGVGTLLYLSAAPKRIEKVGRPVAFRDTYHDDYDATPSRPAATPRRAYDDDAYGDATPRSISTPRHESYSDPYASAATPRSAATSTSTPVDAYAYATPTPRALPAATPAPVEKARSYAYTYATPHPTPKPKARASTVSSARSVSTRSSRKLTSPKADPVPNPTLLPWEDPTVTAKETKDATVAALSAAVPATPHAVATPKPAPTPAPDPNARVIHTRNGAKDVAVNKNIAITGSDGKTVVGVLVQVKGGFVDVRANGQLLRIAEGDVLDAATY